MFSGRFRIADTNIEVVSLYESVQKMCADYTTSSNPSIRIVVTESDIRAEAELSEKMRRNDGRPPCRFSADYLESLAVYRQFATALLAEDVLLFHGSAVAVDGWAYLFTAKSGTGKSTHTALWRNLLGERAVMVNDDKPLIKLTSDGRAIVYGTPWDGKHHLSTNTAVPLKAICWLTRARENCIEPITPATACETLVGQTFCPRTPQQVARMLKLVNQLSTAVGLYKMGCNTEPSAAELAYKTMSK